MIAEIEQIIGRYVRFSIAGRDHRVYFEEAGDGIPLLCLHTAGADARQFQHLLRDEAVTKHFALSRSICHGTASRRRRSATMTRNIA